ncbi:hypothetical protein OG339_42555 [Streptosporangium sp. NBC_01495]|uniref:hypothetical protein n=1 Tax=Streptosporangium sp. NBC_01495 TaxID=2903899 RepID=UPI002E363D26|nr:hypothetical protein [Streptosporangium sp. NBC_01495]
MPHTHPYPDRDLQEVITRNRTARQILTAFFTADLFPSGMRKLVETAMDDTLKLAAEVVRLRANLATARHKRANLIAAARATLAAHHDGETDPLWYLRDELSDGDAR